MSSLARILVNSSRVAKLAGFAFLLAAAAPARAQTPVVFGDTITEPGVYFLNGNQSGAGTGITIESSDVALLLLRFTLRGDGVKSGIFASGYDNIAIYGGRVTNFAVGLNLSGGEDITVKDVRTDHCGDDGVLLRSVDESWLVRVRSDYNGESGVRALNCYETRFLSVLAHDNRGDGILIANEVAGIFDRGNKARLCWAAYNGQDGIRVRDSHDNDIVRNQCVGNSGAGIRLDASSDGQDELSIQVDETRDNALTSNWCVFNDNGIVVEWNATSNTMTNNIALANFDRDMVDHNDAPPCANTWFLNFFLTKGGTGAPCIF